MAVSEDANVFWSTWLVDISRRANKKITEKNNYPISI